MHARGPASRRESRESRFSVESRFPPSLTRVRVVWPLLGETRVSWFSVLLSRSVSLESHAKRNYPVNVKRGLQKVVFFFSLFPGLTLAQFSCPGYHSAFIRPPCWRLRGPWERRCCFLHSLWYVFPFIMVSTRVRKTCAFTNEKYWNQ